MLVLRLLDSAVVRGLPPETPLPQRNNVIHGKVPDLEFIQLIEFLNYRDLMEHINYFVIYQT